MHFPQHLTLCQWPMCSGSSAHQQQLRTLLLLLLLLLPRRWMLLVKLTVSFISIYDR
jgi:hypothetical protein